MSPDVAVAVHGLRVDAAAAAVSSALGKAGVPHLLLKGPTLRTLLYDPGEQRTSTDVDLLVTATAQEAARAALATLGYRRRVTWQRGDARPHAEVWTRDDGSPSVDLHRTLHGVTVDDARTWELLWAARQPFPLAGRAIPTLGPGDQALLLALHASRPGKGIAKVEEDLRRGIARLPRKVWEQAAVRGRLLGADAGMAAGLRRIPAGAVLAADLGVSGQLGAVARLALDPTLPQSLRTLIRIRTLPRGERAGYLLRKLMPSPVFVLDREHVAPSTPFALPRAYGRRWLRLLRTAPAVLRTVRRLRREAR